MFPNAPFVTYYFVHPDFRKRGIGKQLFDGAVAETISNYNVGLHGCASSRF